MISIVIPTYNNLDYLKLCLKSLKKNSSFNHEIIIHINEGSDGTLEFVKNSNHLARDDIYDSIYELRHYRNHFLKIDKH